jgi:hypothetical protein
MEDKLDNSQTTVEIEKILDKLLDGSGTYDWESVDINKRFEQALAALQSIVQAAEVRGRIDELEQQAAVTSGILDPEKCMKLLEELILINAEIKPSKPRYRFE